MRLLTVLAALAAGSLPTGAAGQVQGDPARGGEAYRNCAACHSLLPDVHLSGPSLAGVFGRKAGTAPGFLRYSPGLRSADLTWDENTLNAWLADPMAMIPGTYMIFRGISDDQERADLVAFLRLATAPGGAQAVVAHGLLPQQYAAGQQPEPLKSLPPEQQVTRVRHCGDTYFFATADGAERPFWEMNVRLKLDTRDTGPALGKPAVIGAGMVGDRVSVVFSSLAELASFVVEQC
jgi:cytochrome c